MRPIGWIRILATVFLSLHLKEFGYRKYGYEISLALASYMSKRIIINYIKLNVN